jgi:hypothetical protein
MTGTGKNNMNIYYPYDPSIGGNAFFMVLFLLCGVVLAYQAISKKKYYILVMAVFALSEGGGYLARFLFALDDAPLYPKYLAQVIILVLAPNFVQAYMYAATAELISWSGLQDGSLLKRYGKNLPTYFILIDFVCLCIQGIAGGILGNPHATQEQIDNGKTTILVGLALQLGSLFIFTFVVIAFIYQLHPREVSDLYGYNFVLSVGIALVIIRNIYRVVEYTEGSMTSGTLNENEAYFFVLDGALMAVTCILFAGKSMAYLPEKYESVKANNTKSIEIVPRMEEEGTVENV